MGDVASINQSEPQQRSVHTRATAHAAVHTLSEHLVEVNQLLETSFSSISALFLEISDKVSQLKTSQSDSERQQLQNDIARLVMQSITDMQFQDRVSQNMVIAINVLREAAEEMQVPNDTPMNELTKATMLHLLNLGDIRQKFIGYSISRGFLDSSEAMPEQRQQADEDGDDIELF